MQRKCKEKEKKGSLAETKELQNFELKRKHTTKLEPAVVAPMAKTMPMCGQSSPYGQNNANVVKAHPVAKTMPMCGQSSLLGWALPTVTFISAKGTTTADSSLVECLFLQNRGVAQNLLCISNTCMHVSKRWGRRSGQSVTASDFGSNGPRFESGRGRCVESLDKALYSHCPKEKPSH